MKNRIGILTMLVLSTFCLTFCTEDPEECTADEFCSEPVTACCTDGTCVYEYDGVEYPDTDQGLSDLSDAIGCAARVDLIPSLKALALSAKAASLNR